MLECVEIEEKDLIQKISATTATTQATGKILCRANECKEEDCRGKCYRCGAKGHIKRDCKASRSRSRSARDSPREKSKSIEKQASPYSEDKKSPDQYFLSSAQEYEA